jgi:glycosyltransferase involved in cell wall biosynthesis
VRICVVTRIAHGIGGMQRHTHDLVRGLVSGGNDVEVICPAGQGIEPDAYGARWRFVEAPSDFTKPAWLQASHAEFVRAHSARPFDVVHGEGSSALGLVLAGDHREVPLVTMFHSVYTGLVKASFRRALIGKTPLNVLREARYFLHISSIHFSHGNWYRFRPCEVIVPSHQQIRDTCRSHYLRRSQVHVVPNGVDSDLFRPRVPGSRTRPLVVAGGRQDRHKGLDLVVRAMPSLDAELILTGDGPERQRLERLADALEISERVTFAGRLPTDDLARLISSADVYIFPTLEYEASGLVMLEAMACGVPVVASHSGATAEAISRPGENGMLVTRGSAKALAEAVETLLSDADLRRRMGAAARERVLEEYTIERMTERTVAVYEAAINKPRSAQFRGWAQSAVGADGNAACAPQLSPPTSRPSRARTRSES